MLYKKRVMDAENSVKAHPLKIWPKSCNCEIKVEIMIYKVEIMR